MAITDGLISYYDLDETTGTTATDAHGTYDGTANNTRVLSGAAGIDGNAADFTQGDDKISISQSLADDMVSNDDSYTINMWIKPDNLGNGDNESLITTISSDGYTFRNFLRDGDSDKVSFAINDGSTTEVRSVSSLSQGTWTMVTFLYDKANTNMEIFINGSSDASTSASLSVPTANDNVYLGIDQDGSSAGGDIFMDLVGCWNRALSSSEITDLYNSGNGKNYSELSSADATVNPSALTLSTAQPAEDAIIQVQALGLSGSLSLKAINIVGPRKGAIQEGPDTFKEKAVKRRWPVDEGLTAGTTKQTGKKFLKPTKGSLILKKRNI